MIDIVMPAYNAAETITAAVGSVLAQSLGSWRLIIRDDGSLDNTLDIARGLAREEPRIKVIPSPHLGIVPTMRALWDACEQEFCAQLDADDMLHQNALAHCVALLKANLSFGWCYTQQVILDEVKKVKLLGPQQPLGSGKVGCCSHHLRVMRLAAYKSVGPISMDLTASPDLDLAMRLEKHVLGLFVPEVLYVRRLRAGSISQVQRTEQMSAAAEVGAAPPEFKEAFDGRAG